jgi:hypothetical protein
MTEKKDKTTQESYEGDVQQDPVHTATQQLEVVGKEVLAKVRELVKQGNVRRLIIRTAEGRVLLDTPLNVGAGAGAFAAIWGGLPLMIVTAGVAALARVKIEVVREVGEGDVIDDNHVQITVDDEE